MTLVEVERDLTLYCLLRPDVLADPWPYYERLRATAPVYFDPYLKSWLVTSYRLVAGLLTDRRFSTFMDHQRLLSRLSGDDSGLRRAATLLDRHVSFVDPPVHTRIRAPLAAPFQPRRVAALESRIRSLTADHLDRLWAADDPDAVRGLASPVPMRVVQYLLGAEHIDLAAFRRWSTAWGDVVGSPGHIPTGDRHRVLQAVDELIEHLQELIAEHRREVHRDTVTAALVRAVDDGRLSEEELLANLMMLTTAGAETTTNLISNAVLALTEQPELWERLRADRSLLAPAVEELARAYPPTQYTARIALEDMEVDGHMIRKGQSVVLILAAANRDPDEYGDPHAVRLDRPNIRRHLAFGAGPHFCFGAPLARLEARLVLDGLLDGPRPQPAGPIRWRLNGNLRGLESLPLRWASRDRRREQRFPCDSV
jgi:cytochrome P450